MKILTGPTLLQERRSTVYQILLGIWGQVFLFCLLHDQYLVRLAPEHFTVYHDPIWDLSHPHAIAAAWAFRASIGPGLILAIAALWITRAGTPPRLTPAQTFRRLPKYLIFTELAGLTAGAITWIRRQPLYPETIYPDFDIRLLTSQSIQITCYLAGTFHAILFLRELSRLRHHPPTPAS